MIFLSAQPDDYYFTWQLELQLYNFHKLGISPTNIHVLIGYNTKVGLRDYFKELIGKNKERASFYIYPDNRVNKNYIPSLRPHIIYQHFLRFPCLQEEAVFYHDSDIIFRALPDFHDMQKDETWYVSDTRKYLDSGYIKSTGGESLLHDMCNVVNISIQKIIENDQNCGGAQYLLKKAPTEFWRKIEKDCEALFLLMEAWNSKKAALKYINNGKMHSEFHGIQAWCADMWAIFWNALSSNQKIRIDPRLNFCWADSLISEWYNTSILHYTGNISKEDKNYFRKSNYIHSSPYYDIKLNNITDNTSSYPLVKLIDEYLKDRKKKRIDLSDVSFLIAVRIDSANRLENLYIIIRFLSKLFETNIFIIESDKEQKIDETYLHGCNYEFIRDENPLMHRTRINNLLISKSRTPFIALFDTDNIFPVNQIINSVEQLRLGNADMIYPFDGSFNIVDSLFKTMFDQILDPELFTCNMGKFRTVTHSSYEGTVFLDREKYIRAGMDNEYFTSWGIEDIERVERIKSLGYKVKRTNGCLFYLGHNRKDNSESCNDELYVKLMEEYFRICNMHKNELELYISSWSWVKHDQKKGCYE